MLSFSLNRGLAASTPRCFLQREPFRPALLWLGLAVTISNWGWIIPDCGVGDGDLVDSSSFGKVSDGSHHGGRR